MKNFKIIDRDTGKEYWISRATAVVAIIEGYRPNNNDDEIPTLLISRRGMKTAEFPGKWHFTCGYVDFDENLVGAMKREVYEELGLDLDKVQCHIKHLEVDSEPSHDPNQNIVHRFKVRIPLDALELLIENGTINTNTESRGGEAGELLDIALIKSYECLNYEWAFKHDELIKRLY